MSKIGDKILDRIFVILHPLAGECPVCALVRGFMLGLVMIGVGLGLFIGWVLR